MSSRWSSPTYWSSPGPGKAASSCAWPMTTVGSTTVRRCMCAFRRRRCMLSMKRRGNACREHTDRLSSGAGRGACRLAVLSLQPQAPLVQRRRDDLLGHHRADRAAAALADLVLTESHGKRWGGLRASAAVAAYFLLYACLRARANCTPATP